jgi:rod shape determining protein RodA
MSNSIFSRIDWISILVYLALVGIGFVNIYSATFNQGAPLLSLTSPIGKQLLFGLVGVIGGVLLLAVNDRLFEQLAWPIYGIGVLLLCGLFVFGKTISGAQSWYGIGGFSLQPAEFMKIAMALLIAKILSNMQTNLKSTQQLLKMAALVLLPMALIVLQPDPGSALVFVAFAFVLFREGLNLNVLYFTLLTLGLFLGSVLWDTPIMASITILCLSIVFLFLKRLKYKPKLRVFLLLGSLAIGFIFVSNYIFNSVFEQRHRDRFNLVLGKTVDNQGIGYNTNQSKIAIGSGGFSGKGFLNGSQTKGNFVPEQHTDYIFSTIGEEWGFLGSLVTIALFAFLILRIILQSEKHSTTFHRAFGYGVAALLFFHFFVNVGMALGIVPTIGIPLPFVSYGGSSLLAFTLLLFIYLNFDANRLS